MCTAIRPSRLRGLLILLALLTSSVIFPALAATPRTFPLQGRLTGPGGTPLPDGNVTLTLRLYDAPAGGAPLWSETDTVAVRGGLFSTTMGDGEPFPASLVFDRVYHVGITVGQDPEMTPRLSLAPPWSDTLGSVTAQNLASPLAGLASARSGRPRQQGSKDTSGGNADFRTVPAGQTITLLDYQGAGVIQRFWCTIAPRANEAIHRQAILRMYWDGEATPSVEVPIGDFFGVGFGKQVDFQSTPLNETSGGYNCYWPMPFHKSARWTLTNLSDTQIDAFYYNIDFTAYDALPSSERHFHAQWRRENPTTSGKNYTILEAQGEGHYVGTALFMQNRRGNGLGFLEGDEMFYVDGETTPSISGTGTEDYFSSGWYYDRGVYSAPFHGVPIKDTDLGRVSTYRWHIEDAKPFTHSFRATIEHGTNNDHTADYSSVAYWYQAEPHAPFPPLPANPADLLPWIPTGPFKLPNAVEGEDLVATAAATSGPLSAQDMTIFSNDWSNGAQLWWRPTEAGATLSLHIPAPASGNYALTGYFTKARDYGKIQLMRGAAPVGPELNMYDPDVVASGPVALGTVSLLAGGNDFSVRVTGKDDRSVSYMVGIDAFVLTPQ